MLKQELVFAHVGVIIAIGLCLESFSLSLASLSYWLFFSNRLPLLILVSPIKWIPLHLLFPLRAFNGFGI